MIIDREVERDAWPTFGRPYFAANDTDTAMHLQDEYAPSEATRQALQLVCLDCEFGKRASHLASATLCSY
jgi:hypothetical protein